VSVVAEGLVGTVSPVARGFWRDGFRRLKRNRLAIVGGGLLMLILTAAVIGPFLAPFGPHERVPGGLASAFLPPGWPYLLGTDGQGRDEFSRLLFGAQVSLFVGAGAVVAGAVTGTLIGAVAGYRGGRMDAYLMRVIDVLLAIPSLLLAIGVVAALGRGLPQIMLAVSLANLPIFARLARSSILALRQREYVLAAEGMGAPAWWILGRHLLPNAMTPVIVQATLALGAAIIDVAGLGYLGLGPSDPGIAEWGTMLTEASKSFRQAPLLVFFPGLAIVIAAAAFNLLGDAMRDAFDPRSAS
jgi:peptide/nickel transport system permease protein